MNQSFVTIREALQHSFFIGVHSDLPWFTNLQHRALRALSEIESTPGAVLSGVEHNRHSGTPNVGATHTDAAVATCPWPPGECDE